MQHSRSFLGNFQGRLEESLVMLDSKIVALNCLMYSLKGVFFIVKSIVIIIIIKVW